MRTLLSDFFQLVQSIRHVRIFPERTSVTAMTATYKWEHRIAWLKKTIAYTAVGMQNVSSVSQTKTWITTAPVNLDTRVMEKQTAQVRDQYEQHVLSNNDH